MPRKPDLRVVPPHPPKDYEDPTPPDSSEPEYVVNVHFTGLEDAVSDTEKVVQHTRGVFYFFWFLIGLLTGALML